MALINRDAFPLQFERNITRMVNEGYALYDAEWNKVTKPMNAERGNKYEMAQFTGLGAVRELPEGSGVEFDTPVEGHRHSISFLKYGLGYQITEEMANDTLNPAMLNALARSLGEQHRYRQDLAYWRMFAQANATTYRTAWDAKAICANDHVTLKSGTTIDNLASAALSETALQAAFQYFYTQVVSEEGIPLNINPDMLIVGKDKHFTAMQLMNQTTGVTVIADNGVTNNNDNKVNPSNGYVSPYSVMASKVLAQLATIYGTDPWFLVDSKQMDAMFIWKSKFKLESGDDFRTGNALFKGTQRFGVGFGDYKAVYGSFA